MAQIVERIASFFDRYVTWLTFPNLKWTDIVEMLIIAYLLYRVLVWIKDTKAWSLLRGIIVILIFVFVAALFSMTTILWIAKNIFSVAVTAMVVVFQPELRKALEQLGKKKMFSGLLQFDNTRVTGQRFSDKTIQELIRATYVMGRERTGALIVISKDDSLEDYTRTGIMLDSMVSSQLLVNIFEHNTPLHDGAVVIEGDRIVSATCYLPLSDNMELSKELGTRHRAGIGITETSDAFVIIVSEETGIISVCENGKIKRPVAPEQLKSMLMSLYFQEDSKKKLHDRLTKSMKSGKSGGEKNA